MSEPLDKCAPECMWCGGRAHGRGRGPELRARPNCFGGHVRYECVDRVACDKEIKRRILIGPPGALRR